MSFDKIAALYVFSANYHNGQNSRLYRLLSKIVKQYKPHLTDHMWRRIENGIGNSWEEAHEIYNTLVDNLNRNIYHSC